MVDPFDYIENALAFKGAGMYFFPLNVVSHHSAMIVALIIPGATMTKTFEEQMPSEDGEGTETRERSVSWNTSAFGGSTFLFFMDQFNDETDLGSNLVTPENGMLESKLMHFTIGRGFLRTNSHAMCMFAATEKTSKVGGPATLNCVTTPMASERGATGRSVAG